MYKKLLNGIFFILLVFTLSVVSIIAKEPSRLLINGESTDYVILIKNGVSYMKSSDFSDIFSSEPPQKTDKSIIYIKRSIPKEESFLEIEFKDNSVSWNGSKTGAYAIKYNGDLYLPIKSICKYLDYIVYWDSTTNTVNLESYYTKSTLEKVVNVIGLDFPICLFDTLPIGKRPNNMPFLSYLNDNLGEKVYFSESIINLNMVKNLFIHLGLSPEKSDGIINSLYEMDGFETKEFLFLDKAILSVYATSDGTYTFTFSKKY